jgi:hypothetical protein
MKFGAVARPEHVAGRVLDAYCRQAGITNAVEREVSRRGSLLFTRLASARKISF